MYYDLYIDIDANQKYLVGYLYKKYVFFLRRKHLAIVGNGICILDSQQFPKIKAYFKRIKRCDLIVRYKEIKAHINDNLVPVIYVTKGVNTEVCLLEQDIAFFLHRKKCLVYNDYIHRCFVKNIDDFIRNCLRMTNMPEITPCIECFMEIKKMEDIQNCKILDEPVLSCGGLVDVSLALEPHKHCPRCNSQELRLVKHTSYSPAGFRLACAKCDFEVPEFLEDSAYTTEEGVKLASKTWDDYVNFALGKEVFNDLESEKFEIKLENETLDLNSMEFLDKMKESEEY